jgi:hypothetical protein
MLQFKGNCAFSQDLIIDPLNNQEKNEKSLTLVNFVKISDLQQKLQSIYGICIICQCRLL